MFTLYKSSAGSGKTFTLVKEYLKLCLNNPEKYPRVLAITFTNKAAAEMKSRIMNSLHEFLSTGRNAIVEQVIRESGLEADSITKNAKKLQTAILHAYSDFSVMTIDSFISRIVSTFARDLNMPLKYDVELDTDTMTREIIEKLMAGAAPDSFLGDVLVQFALSKIHTTGSWNTDGELQKLGQVVFNEKHIEELSYIGRPEFDSGFWRELIDEIEEAQAAFRQAVNSRAQSAMAIINRHGLMVKDFYYGNSGPAGSLKRYARAAVVDEFKVTDRFRKMVWVSQNKDQETRDRIEAALADGVERLALEILDLIDQGMTKYISLFLIQKNIYTEALIHQFVKQSELLKEEKNRLPLIDFSRKVSEVIVHEPVPFLYWRMGNRYSHILIDEFQDTSLLQWHNLLPLIEEALARGQFNMAVGDGKQAIYRWRAGDVRIMEGLLPQALGPYLDPRRLTHNYRSRKEIVAFNNAFFESVARLDLFEGMDLFHRLYGSQGAVQQIASDQTGYVQVQPVEMAGLSRKEDRQAALLQTMIDTIQQVLLEDNQYTCADMAVLVRTNDEAQLAAQALFKAGYAVISPDSLRLGGSPEVRFVIHALRYLTANDRIALLSMWLYLKKEMPLFYRHCANRQWHELEKIMSPRFYQRKGLILQLPVYEAVEEIIEIFHLNAANSGFLQGLLEVVLDYTDTFSTDIAGFLEWWDLYRDSDRATLPSGGQANAITLSTIHKAKGLEYSIVLLPFSWHILADLKNNFLWAESDGVGRQGRPFYFMPAVQKKIEASWFAEIYHSEKMMESIDNINSLYVAFTRAVDRLYVTIPDEKVSDKGKLDTSDIIRNSLPELPLQKREGMWCFGTPGRKAEGQPSEASEQIRGLPVYGWRQKITVKKRAVELWQLEDSHRKRQVRYGQLIHDILEQVQTSEDIGRVIEDFQRQGLVSRADADSVFDSINKSMNLPVGEGIAADWFKPGLTLKNEKTIAFENHEYRPDRVILKADETLVIDYKTGIRDAEHHHQLRNYGRLLKQMGYPHVRLFLLYMEEGVEEVLWNS